MRQGDAAVDVASLTAHLREVMLASGLVTAGSADGGATGGPTVRVTGQVASETVEADHKGLCRAGVNLTLTTRPSDAPGALNDDISAQGEDRFEVGPAVDPRALAGRLIDRTARDLLASYLGRARLRTAGPAEIHAALTSGVGPLREEAIRQAGAHHLTAEAPLLLGLLDDPDEATRDAALGALIALRDQRAVAKLTRDRSLRDRREMLKILDAISQIGGEEADEYLSFVAASHDDPEIRQAAREARARMARRAGADAGR